MAERRMFAKTIVDSDAFLEMPMSARLLYYDLSMRADDDGFVNSPKKIMKFIGATNDDMNILIHRKFVLAFDNGVVVIKHWRIHNYIRQDRYKETTYVEQKEQLEFDENNAYRLKNDNVYTHGQPMVDQRLTQVRLGKDRLVKEKDTHKEKDKEIKKQLYPTLEEVEAYCRERNNNVDAKAFYDYYSIGGWKDSKGNAVKNWKQKVITWEKDGRKDSRVPDFTINKQEEPPKRPKEYDDLVDSILKEIEEEDNARLR